MKINEEKKKDFELNKRKKKGNRKKERKKERKRELSIA